MRQQDTYLLPFLTSRVVLQERSSIVHAALVNEPGALLGDVLGNLSHGERLAPGLDLCEQNDENQTSCVTAIVHPIPAANGH